MLYKINYFDEAVKDIYLTKEWYQIQSDGLEIKFIDSLEEAVNKLEIYPTAFSIRLKQIRCIKLNKFPYKIWFYVSKNDVIIIAVIHNKRDDKLIRKRVKK